jgi:hypothetical protein
MTVFDPAMNWCVLRMSDGATLPVMHALRDESFEVWTPSEMQRRRVGRDRKRVEVVAPLLPTFVFARYDRLSDLLALSKAPAQAFRIWDQEQRRMVTKGRPHFTVMRHGGGYPAVSDQSLDALRTAEQRGRPIAEARAFLPGERVKCPSGGFQGLVGIVQTTKGRHALVAFNGLAIPVSIPAVSLLPAA